MKRISKNAGFSLVELMVVVAIIGILAAVAIPNFTKFQRRARASEGRAMLSAIYDGEKSAYASYEGYDDNFAMLGFKPEGNQLRTDAGFTSAGVHPLSATAVGAINHQALVQAQTVVADGNSTIVKYCAAAVPAGSCSLASGAAPTQPPTNAGAVVDPAVPGTESFVAGSSTDCGSTKTDEWKIDNNKTISQTQDCTNVQ